MTSIVDAGSDSGSAQRAFEDLSAEATALETPANPQTRQAAKPGNTGATEDARFAGKSREDILSMYHNLESHQGRLANELGQQRRTLDQLLLDKRSSDLQSNGGGTGAPAPVTAADLLERPNEVLERAVDARIQSTIQPLTEQIRSLNSSLASSQVVNRFGPNWIQTVQSPEFQTWARRTPMRMQAVQRAREGDWSAAEAILAEYTDFTEAAAPSTAQQRAHSAAARVGLESTQAGSDGGSAVTGKTIRRQDLWALRVNDPDRYERMQPEILRAYQEGRVVG